MADILFPSDQLTTSDREIATKLALRAARDDLLAFILLMDPDFNVAPHHRILCDHLMSIYRGTSTHNRLMVFMPPRSSKSLITSKYGPAWALGINPRRFLIEVSHNVTLATDFGREVRNILASDLYRMIFPGVEIKKGSSAADDWQTTGGGRFLSAGVGSGLAGHGAHIATIDDPLSEQDAFSKAARDRVTTWYPGGLRTRLMPGGSIVITNTRWHENDLSGWLLREAKTNPFADTWETVDFPALNTTKSLALLSKARLTLISQGYLDPSYPELILGESFWPAPSTPGGFYWDTRELIVTKSNMPGYQWDALYMQNPTNPEGGILRPADWQIWKEKPPACEYTFISMDTAFSTKTSADYSALTVWGIFRSDGGLPQMLMLGAEKGRWDFPTLRSKVIEKYNYFKPDTILIEKKASGQSLIQDLRMMGLPISEYQPDRDKEARAHSIAPIFQSGRIYVPEGRKFWADVIEECRSFPTAQHDDYVDTVTQAVLWARDLGFAMPKDSLWKSTEDDDIIAKRTQRRFY